MIAPPPRMATDGNENTKRVRERMPRPPLKQTKTSKPRPSLAQADATDGLKLLLNIEAETRRASCLDDLFFLIANETRKLTSARQIFVFRGAEKLRMVAISGIPKMDRDTPLIQDIESYLADENIASSTEPSQTLNFTAYTFPHQLWIPMKARDGSLLGGFLLVRETDWHDADYQIAERIAQTYAHAMAALIETEKRPSFKFRLQNRSRKFIIAGGVAALLAMAIPVPMQVLAPMEVMAHNPFIVAAPNQGVIEEVMVNPGDMVAKNQPLVRMGGTELRNKLEVAQRQVSVAQARLKKANQLAFAGDEGGNELRMAMADLSLKSAELRFAKDMFNQSVIRAEQDGVAVLSDKQALSGKPVVTGERIMQIANPKQVEIIVHLPVSDSIVLQPNAKVKVFLDSDPINSRDAVIAYGDYQALPANGDQLVFRVVAKLIDDQAEAPRLGVRGTARIYGEQTILGLYLFRRPLAAVRQWVGL